MFPLKFNLILFFYLFLRRYLPSSSLFSISNYFTWFLSQILSFFFFLLFLQYTDEDLSSDSDDFLKQKSSKNALKAKVGGDILYQGNLFPKNCNFKCKNGNDYTKKKSTGMEYTTILVLVNTYDAHINFSPKLKPLNSSSVDDLHKTLKKI